MFVPHQVLIVSLNDPRRASHRRQILLRCGTTCRLFIPGIHDAIPFTIGGSINHIRLGIHAAQNHPPFAARRIATTDPFIRVLGTGGGGTFLTTGQGRLTSLVGFVALQTTDPNAEMLARPSIRRTFRSRRRIVFFLRGRATRTLGVILVHGAIPLRRQFAFVHHTAETSPLKNSEPKENRTRFSISFLEMTIILS